MFKCWKHSHTGYYYGDSSLLGSIQNSITCPGGWTVIDYVCKSSVTIGIVYANYLM